MSQSKKVEMAVKNIINGLKINNKDSIANPESLDYFKKIIDLLIKLQKIKNVLVG